MITSHIGRNPYAIKLYEEGKLDVEFCPLGTLMERIRADAAGLGGVLVKTGLGTEIEENARLIDVDGETYILATPLHADLALVHARRADWLGNLSYYGTCENSNPIIAMANCKTIAEADSIVEINEIGIESIKTPGAFIDMILCEKE